MTTVNAEDLEDAVLMVSEAGTDAQAWVSLDTGEVYIRSDLVGAPVPLPEDIDSSERYLPVPSMNTLDLGLQLVFDFADAAVGPSLLDRLDLGPELHAFHAVLVGVAEA